MRLPAVPLWLKYVLTLAVFVPLSVAAVIYIHGPGAPDTPGSENPAAAAQADHLGRIVSQQDQAVHRATLSPSLAPKVALQRAILVDVRMRIAGHDIAGPAGRVSCDPLAHIHAGRLPFRCRALAGGFSYPFAGVVDARTRQLTWCKNDNTSVDPALRVPLSSACTS